MIRNAFQSQIHDRKCSVSNELLITRLSERTQYNMCYTMLFFATTRKPIIGVQFVPLVRFAFAWGTTFDQLATTTASLSYTVMLLMSTMDRLHGDDDE